MPCRDVAPVHAIGRIDANLAASELLVEDRDGKDGAHGVGGGGGDVLLYLGDLRVAGFVVGCPRAGDGVDVGDALYDEG